jgi:FkbM family methyltransferase
MTFEMLVESALSALPRRGDLAAVFLSENCKFPRYVIGRNEEAAAVLGRVSVDGVIDDYANNLSHWCGVPVCSLKSVPATAIVVNCSTSISPVAVIDNLNSAGLNNILNYSDLLKVKDGKFPLPWFVKQQRDDWQENHLRWKSLYERLEDEQSKRVLLDVCRYRLTADPEYMRGYAVRLKDQYFEDFMRYGQETFVDAGGFDGDTTETFCQRYPDYASIFLFEPSSKNITAAKERLKHWGRINFLQLGLSDQVGTLSFNADAGSASAVSSAGSEIIEVVTLDEAVHEPVSFIKMDLEGWELKALSGSKGHILRHKPKLAISVYHGAADFHRIPEFIFSLNNQYRLYLRHYTQGWSETVMFFLPI